MHEQANGVEERVTASTRVYQFLLEHKHRIDLHNPRGE